jgi:outer membrane immunogenic protein
MRGISAAACVLGVTALPAAAADVAAPVSVQVAPPREAAAPWSGFYVGVMGGYGSGRLRDDFGGQTDVSGGFGGGTIGFNVQPWNTGLVLGVEADAAGAQIGKSSTALVLGVPVTVASTIDAFGTLRGRLGYAFGPALVYATGGLALVHNELSATALGVRLADSQTHMGWTAGGGLEWAFTPNWSIKAEYLYLDFGREIYFGGFGAQGYVHTLKGGINYRFNWGAPIAASY